MFKKFVFLYIFILGFLFQIINVISDCNVERKHLTKESPILLLETYRQKHYLLEATYRPKRGNEYIVIPNGKIVYVACPDSNVTLDNHLHGTVNCKCQNRIFHCNNKPYSYSQIKCSNVPKPTIDKPTANNEHFKIGFNIDDHFLTLIDGEYDNMKDITRYTHHTVLNSINDVTVNDVRPPFVEPSFPRCGNAYTLRHQKKNIGDILQQNVNSYFKEGQSFLAKGHLTPNVDYGFTYQRRATFYYHNAVPQWQQINNGHWKTLEADIRRIATKNSDYINVYTGATGISQLQEKDLYLCRNNKLPIPKFVYKIVTVPGSTPTKGVAFVMSNNPYNEDESSSFVCNNVCNSSSVQHFIHVDHTDCANSYQKGCLYCCAIDSMLKQSIPDLPVNYMPVGLDG